MKPVRAAIAILAVLIPTCCHAFESAIINSPGVKISPARVTLVSKGTQQFSTTVNEGGIAISGPGATVNSKLSVNGFGRTQIQWMVAGVAGGNAKVGTISSSGLYTAPAVVSNMTVTLAAVEASNRHVVANAIVVVQMDPAVEDAHQQWLAGVATAAKRYGCTPELIQQLPNETVADAVKLYAQTANKGTCLVLQPVSTDSGPAWYSFASGGSVDGVDILYLSDVSRMRIWNGAEVSGD